MSAIILVCIFNITAVNPTGITKQIPLTLIQAARYQSLRQQTTSVNEADTSNYTAGAYLTGLCGHEFGMKPNLNWTLND